MKKLLLLSIIPFLSFGQNLGFDVVTVDTTFYHQGCSWYGSPIAYTVPEGKVAKIQYAYPWNFSVNGIDLIRAISANEYYTIIDNPIWLDSGDAISYKQQQSTGSSNPFTTPCLEGCLCEYTFSCFLSILEFTK